MGIEMFTGKGKAARTTSNEKTGNNTVSSQAGLILSTARVKKILVQQKCASRYSQRAIVYLTAALEYIVGELLEVSSIKAQEAKKNTINNRHIYLGANADSELKQILLGTGGYVKDAGFVSINPAATTKKKVVCKKKSKKVEDYE